jgi:sugar O-acyltransferase (sialic acid O-acetyltransferase NeuD family)
MTPRPVVVVGAGGFGRETLDVVAAINAVSAGAGFDLLGVVDDDLTVVNGSRLTAGNVAYMGTVSCWLEQVDQASFLLAIGDPSTRRRVAQRLEAAGRQAATAVHPGAVLGSATVIGVGSIVCSGVQVSTNVRLGRYVHLNPNATVGHDTFLGDWVSVNPAATVSGDCQVGPGVLLGAASVVLAGLSVGPGATVGAAACVVTDVRSDTVVVGVPARELESSRC